MIYTVPFEEVVTSAVINTYKTIAAIVAGDTAGYRARLRELTLGCSDDSPADRALSVLLKRIDDLSGGGAGTTTAVTPVPRDSLGRAAVITAAKNYTDEPTVYGNQLWELELNLRISLFHEWPQDLAPIVNRDQLLGLLCAPRTANAATLSGSLVFEEF